jgi:signal transduction histidine kinase
VASIRTRLTVAYAGALVATIVSFAAALVVARMAGSEAVLERVAHSEAELAAVVLRQAAMDSAQLLTDDNLAPKLREDVGSRLAVLPDYLVVLDRQGRVMFNSAAARALATVPEDRLHGLNEVESYPIRQQAYERFESFVNVGRALRETGATARLEVGDEHLIVTMRLLREPSGQLDRVVVGVPYGWMRYQAQREVVGTILVIAPLLMVLSIGVAYVIAGRIFQPMERLMSELEAISDGRSLHRRLHLDGADDELARLTVTLNAMLGRLENYFGALRRFTADASHELKTPLAVLRADVERAMDGDVASSERLEALEEALQETTRMADLVEQLLTLARADEGRFDVHREPVALEPLVRDVFETASILGEAAGLTVSLTMSEPATVMGDPARLRQLFLNLLTNAIKYTPNSGEVEVRLRRAGDVVTFSVRDSGIGIAAADLPYIFDRFWRADRVRSRIGERGGFGLGLAICQWIAQAHGGTLTAASRLTRGSTFTVTLPLAPEGSTAEYPAQRRVATGRAGALGDGAPRGGPEGVEGADPGVSA